MKKNAPFIEAGFSNKQEYQASLVDQNNNAIIAGSLLTAKQVRQMLKENEIDCDVTYFLANSLKNERIWICKKKDKLIAVVVDSLEETRVIQ